jgi:Tol biopolymer transport system component
MIMAIGLTGCGAPSGPAPGSIVFSGRPADDPEAQGWQLLVMNPDGSGLRRLTRTDGDVAPSWSPDGTKVVFARATYIEDCSFDPACAQIWIVEADGTDERRLTPASARSEAPDWSPDGDRIVFQQWNVPYDYSGQIDIYAMNVDGSDIRQLTDGPGANEDPAWSPDGERIVFSRYVDGEYEIWVMNAEGSEQRRLTPRGVSAHSPAWSPDGEKIAVTRQSGDDCDAIVVMNEDGTEERTLLPPGEGGGGPAWSPDGSQIAFIHCYENLGEDENLGEGEADIWVMDADGGNAHTLQAGPYTEPGGLDWAAARD